MVTLPAQLLTCAALPRTQSLPSKEWASSTSRVVHNPFNPNILPPRQDQPSTMAFPAHKFKISVNKTTLSPSLLLPSVATVDLDCGKLDLKSIAMRARNAEYNPKRFAAVIMRIREPRTTALIFSSGKMVCTGKKQAASRLLVKNRKLFY